MPASCQERGRWLYTEIAGSPHHHAVASGGCRATAELDRRRRPKAITTASPKTPSAAAKRCQAARTSYLSSPTRWVKGAHAAADDDKSRKNLQSFLKSLCNARDNYSMAVRSDAFESAKSHFFDTSSWGVFCDVTLTLKQARQPDSGGWVKIDDYRCRQAFRHFMNLLNSSIRSGISSIRQKASCITRT